MIASFFKNESMRSSYRTQCLHHKDLLGLVPDGVGVIEPAVVLVSHFAVSQREALVCGLRQPFAILHLDQLEVAAVALARILLLTSVECFALHTISVKTYTHTPMLCLQDSRICI